MNEPTMNKQDGASLSKATGPRESMVLCADSQGLHRMAYREWGDPDNLRVLVCVHGLTRNGRDFDRLAGAFSAHFRVVCPDIAGRGKSDHLKNPADYVLPQYVSDIMALLARLNVESVAWLGTSMGGLIGMIIAAQVRSPIQRLVLNDVGPVITADALRRIGEYVGNAPLFESFEAAEAYIRLISAPFGHLPDADWRSLTESSVRQDADGHWEIRYDPAIGHVFRAASAEMSSVNLWPLYDAITCPTLVVRGETSDLLTSDIHKEMANRGPCASLATAPGVGHAPMFLDEGQMGLVRDFLFVPNA